MEDRTIKIAICILILVVIVVIVVIVVVSDDEENNASCITPSTEGYNFTNESGSLLLSNFNVTGVTCHDEYDGTVTTSVCNTEGSPYNVSGCSLIVVDHNSNPNSNTNSNPNSISCNSTFTPEELNNTYRLIDGVDITNFDLLSLRNLNEDINCSNIGASGVSCSGTVNSSGSVNCSGNSSGIGIISCNSSGIFILGGCLNASAEVGTDSGEAAPVSGGTVPPVPPVSEPPAAAPVNCRGSWGTCESTCSQTYTITTPASNGGEGCTNPAPGATQDCTGGNCNPCSPNPCQNGGTCNNNGRVAECSCVDGFTGSRCETSLVGLACPSNSPCRNPTANPNPHASYRGASTDTTHWRPGVGVVASCSNMNFRQPQSGCSACRSHPSGLNGGIAYWGDYCNKCCVTGS